MATLAIAGLYNLETNLGIQGFPLPYYPVCFPFHQIQQSHAGVGYNLSCALHRLGHQIQFASLIAADSAGRALRQELATTGLATDWLLDSLTATAQSVILVAPDGRRQIHCDLKDIQDTAYPTTHLESALTGAELLICGNINFARPFLQAARQRQLPIACDVQVLHQFDDDYNRDFLQASQILFLSHEALPCPAADAIPALQARYPAQIIVIGLGADGALLGERGRELQHVPAQQLRPVVNTVGAGDALMAAFVDQYLRTDDARLALNRAVQYAGWKVGASGATQGLLTQQQFEQLYQTGSLAESQ